MRSTKSVDLIGHIEFLLWGQLDGCSVTRPFLSHVKGVACETIVMEWQRFHHEGYLLLHMYLPTHPSFFPCKREGSGRETKEPRNYMYTSSLVPRVSVSGVQGYYTMYFLIWKPC